MTREEQILNGFTKMMKGFWNNQDLEVPNLETPCKPEEEEEKMNGFYLLDRKKGDQMSDLISRQAAIDALGKRPLVWLDDHYYALGQRNRYDLDKLAIETLPSAQWWIPCSERLPEDIKPVIVTWKNTDPKSYYMYIVGRHYIGTACCKDGKWYWYSSTTEDMLAEYDSEEFDEAIECIAWMPLPEPYKEGEG